MLLTSTLSALWLATCAWGAVQTDEDGTVKSIGVGTMICAQFSIHCANFGV